MADQNKQPKVPSDRRSDTSQLAMEEYDQRQPKLTQLHTLSLESDTDQSENEDPENTTLTPGHDTAGASLKTDERKDADPNLITLAIVNEKVDRLLQNFATFDKKLEKSNNKSRKKFLSMQNAHNNAIERINVLSDRADKSEDTNEQTSALLR